MRRFLELCFAIALRRAGPEHLPQSEALMYFSGAVYVVMFMLFNLVAGLGVLPTVVATVLEILIMAIVFAGALNALGLSARIPQVFSAMFGTGTLIALLLLPLVLLRPEDPSAQGISGALALAMLLALVWSLVITVHIVQRASGRSTGEAMLLVLVYFVLDVVITDTALQAFPA